MDAARWTLVKSRLAEALDLPEADRTDFLARLDAEVRAEVSALLAASATDDLLDAPLDTGLLPTGVERAQRPGRRLGAEVAPAGADPLLGARVGPYRVETLAGRGGMADVYRARRADGLFDREVALKVVRPGADAEALLARFAAERRILGGLEHEGIARLIGAGAEADGPAAGRPWLALEFVRGVPITEAALRLGADARLRLMVDVAEAVQHAHRRLVVHRDLKPSNVLVGGGDEGLGIGDSDRAPTHSPSPQSPTPNPESLRVKLLDFGIAKLLDPEADADLTALDGRRPMTRAYAAPEQIREQPITTATDVYGLGVLLYEVLTAARPFSVDEGLRALEAAILAGNPPAPSAATRPEAGGLDPRRLRGDLDVICLKALAVDPAERYASASAFADDLRRVLVSEPVAARRPSRAYRARKFVGRHRLGVAVAAGVVALLVGEAALYTTRVTVERDRAEAALAESEATATFLEGVLGAASPFAAGRRDTLRAADLLGDAVREVDAMDAPPGRQAHLYTVIGRAYRDLGQTAEADSLLRRALALAGDDPARWPAAAGALGGTLLRGDSLQIAEAITLYRRVLDDAEARLAPDDPARADAHVRLGLAYWTAQRYAEAVPHAERGVALHRSADPPDSVGLGNALKGLADALASAQRRDEAEPVFREMIAVRRAVYGPDHPSLPVGLNTYALFLRNSGRPAEAVPVAREALRISRTALGPDHPHALSHAASVATLLRDEDPDAAAALLADIIERVERTQGPRAGVLPIRYDDLSRALLAAERYDEAEAALRTGLGLARAKAGTPSVGGGSFTGKLAHLAQRRGDPEAAVRLWRAAVDEFAAVFGSSENAFSAGALNGYGQALQALDRKNEARVAYTASVSAFEAAYGPDHAAAEGVRERLASLDG
ncbi:MAG: serine/threonine-protein kinase [Bacteroidota bacterium]